MPAPRPQLDPRSCLITGGAGFVGAALCLELLNRGWNVRVVDDLSAGRLDRLPLKHPRLSFLQEDMARPGLLAASLRGCRAGRLVHLAGPVGVRRVLADPQEAGRSIQALGQAVLRELGGLAAEERPRLFAASTSEVYADSPQPLHEGSALRAQGGAARWLYASAKLACEQRFDAAGLGDALEGPVHLRLFNVVGPGQDSSSGMVLPTFVERALAGRVLPVHGDGQQRRTYGHVDQVAADLASLLERPRVEAGPLNLGGVATASALELARCVLRACSGGPDPDAGLEYVNLGDTLAGFAEVRCRIPNLDRARSMGLVQAPMDLAAIVADTLARHGSEPLAAAPCASPAS